MTKISNKENAVTVKLSDRLLGTDENGKTKNYIIEGIVALVNSVAGKDYISYKFSPTDYGSIGSFTSNTSNTNPSLITKLFFNKKSASKEDLTALFAKLDTLQNIVIELRNPSDSNNFATFKITNITNHTDYFELDVVVYKSFFSGALTSGVLYSAYFDVKENFEDKLDKGDFEGTAETLNADIQTRVVKVEGSSLVPDAEIEKLEVLDATADINKPVSTSQASAIALKESLSNKSLSVLTDYLSDNKYPSVKSVYDWVTTEVVGAPLIGSIVPTDTPTGTGEAFWFATQSGTYVNFGGGVVGANEFAVFVRNSGGVFTMSKTSLDLSNYTSLEKTDEVVDRQNIIAGIDFFTISGYINNTTGALAVDANYKCTDYISVTAFSSLSITSLDIAGAFRQASFFSAKSSGSLISSYTTNDNANIVLDSTNIPIGSKYVRLNTHVTKMPTLIADGAETNTQLTAQLVDKENNIKLNLGINLFTIVGYVHMTTGIPDSNAGFKHTDYLSLESIDEIKVENLTTAGAFRQASFFRYKNPAGIISSYTADSANTIVLNKTNIPSTAKYVIFNTSATSIPIITLGKLNYKAAVPVNTLLGKASWKNINTVTGYSDYWGQYWNGSAFVNDNNFNGQLYAVDTLNGFGTIHIKGWFYGNMPIVVFFQDQSLTLHVANGVKNGTITPSYYDFYENVPAGANYALVQQSRTGHSTPFMERVIDTIVIEEKSKVVLIGDSLSQMPYYADELMGHIKEIAPEYDIYNYGVGGERTVEIASRIGAFQMFLTPENAYLTTNTANGQKFFDLPSTTATVDIGANAISNSWNATKLNLLRQDTPILDCKPNTVFINGIECLLIWTGTTYTLNRVVAGTSAYSVFYGTQLVPKNSLITTENDIVILNFSQNGGWTGVDDLVAQYQRTIDTLGTKKYIVMSSHYAQNGDPVPVDSVINRIIQEDALKKAFGAKYINIREYFCSTALHDALATTYWNNDSYPTDTVGETHPTATDTSYMTQGLYAPMWWVNPNNPADIIHISRRTYAIMYAHIFKIMKALKYFE